MTAFDAYNQWYDEHYDENGHRRWQDPEGLDWHGETEDQNEAPPYVEEDFGDLFPEPGTQAERSWRYAEAKAEALKRVHYNHRWERHGVGAPGYGYRDYCLDHHIVFNDQSGIYEPWEVR